MMHGSTVQCPKAIRRRPADGGSQHREPTRTSPCRAVLGHHELSPPLFIIREPFSCQVSVARIRVALKVLAIDQALDPLLQVWRLDGKLELLEQL